MPIAIVIPAFNEAPFLAEAVESALGQTRSAAAVVVVDDGSADSTLAIARRYAPAVTVIHQPRGGVAVARNRGAAAVPAADWILFLDADDQLRPDALESLSSPAVPSAVGVIYGQSFFVDARASGRRLHGDNRSCGPVPCGARANFWRSVMASTGAGLVRKTVFDRVGGFRSRFDTLADRDLWIRIGLVAEFAFVPRPVLDKRVHADCMSGDRNHSRIQAVEVQLDLLEWCRDRQIPAGWLSTSPGEIISRNLARAMAEQSYEAAARICGLAGRMGVDTPAIRWKSRSLGLRKVLHGAAARLAALRGA